MQRRRPPAADDEGEVGETFFRTSLVVFAALVFATSAKSAAGRGGYCPRGAFCVAPDSTLPTPASILDTEGIFDGLGQLAAHEDPTFVGAGNVSRIFTCGINAWLEPTVELLFPEYRAAERVYTLNMMKCRVDRVLNRARALGLSVEDSLLMVRPTIEGVGFVNESSFPGKVLYINTENGAYLIPKSQYGLGPYRDTNHTMRLYLASLYLNTLDDNLKSLIIGRRPEGEETAATPAAASTAPPRPKSTKENFALFVASSHCSDLRLDTVRRLSEVGTVHVAGHCVRRLRKMCHRWGTCAVGRNERIVPINVTERGFDRGSTDVNRLRNQSFWSLHDYYHRYRFAMVFENKRLRGYVTEKIVNAFLGGAVPIYYGTDDVFEVFNRDAMVFFDDTKPNASINLIRDLTADEDAYDAMVSRPILANGTRTVEDVFSLNDTLGNGKLKRRIRRMVLGER